MWKHATLATCHIVPATAKPGHAFQWKAAGQSQILTIRPKSFNTKNGRFLKKVFRAPKYAILRAFGKRLAYRKLKNIDKFRPVIYAYLPCNLCQITM